jgi:hypothetical protein
MGLRRRKHHGTAKRLPMARPCVAQSALRSLQVGRWIGRPAEHGRGTASLDDRTETEWFRICWQRATVILFMAKRLTFVKPDGTPCTTSSGEKANSGAPPVLVAFGDYDAMRLRGFAAEHCGALVERWQLSEVRRC